MESLQKNIQQAWGGIPYWQGDAFKGGKQHMLTHAIQAYKRQAKHFIVIDDNKEVHAVIQRAIEEQTYGPDISLTVLPVNFMTIYSDPLEYYMSELLQYFPTPAQLSPPSKEDLMVQKILG